MTNLQDRLIAVHLKLAARTLDVIEIVQTMIETVDTLIANAGMITEFTTAPNTFNLSVIPKWSEKSWVDVRPMAGQIVDPNDDFGWTAFQPGGGGINPDTRGENIDPLLVENKWTYLGGSMYETTWYYLVFQFDPNYITFDAAKGMWDFNYTGSHIDIATIKTWSCDFGDYYGASNRDGNNHTWQLIKTAPAMFTGHRTGAFWKLRYVHDSNDSMNNERAAFLIDPNLQFNLSSFNIPAQDAWHDANGSAYLIHGYYGNQLIAQGGYQFTISTGARKQQIWRFLNSGPNPDRDLSFTFSHALSTNISVDDYPKCHLTMRGIIQ